MSSSYVRRKEHKVLSYVNSDSMNLQFRLEQQIPGGRGHIPIPNTGQYQGASRVECNVQYDDAKYCEGEVFFFFLH